MFFKKKRDQPKPEELVVKREEEKKGLGMGYTVTLLSCFAMIGYAIIVSQYRAARSRTAADALAEMEAEMDARAADVQAIASFPPEEEDPHLTSDLMQVTRDLHGGLDHCMQYWPDHPEDTYVRLTSDRVGRLTGLAVQGAPPDARQCLQDLLEKGRYERNLDAVARLRINFGGTSIEEVGGVQTDLPSHY
jgi:hypothetical protein